MAYVYYVARLYHYHHMISKCIYLTLVKEQCKSNFVIDLHIYNDVGQVVTDVGQQHNIHISNQKMTQHCCHLGLAIMVVIGPQANVL